MALGADALADGCDASVRRGRELPMTTIGRLGEVAARGVGHGRRHLLQRPGSRNALAARWQRGEAGCRLEAQGALSPRPGRGVAHLPRGGCQSASPRKARGRRCGREPWGAAATGPRH
eukprot:4853231-Pyramimonas_sp.AAC.1